MVFNEANTVEALVRDLLCGKVTATASPPPGFSRKNTKLNGVGWHYLPAQHIPRQPQDVFVESFLRDALIRLNPEIAANPNRAEEVLYRLRAIVLSVRSDGIIRANEEFTAWLRGDRSMPFGENHEHTTVRLIDPTNLDNNQYIVTTQYTFRAGPAERRADLVLLINGLPLVLIEAKTPVRKAVSWVDGALQVHDDYEKNVPELFACNVFSVATEGKELRYGSIRMPVELWGVWRLDDDAPPSSLADLWEALSPDPILQQHEADYKWLSQVYVSVQPTTGMGKLIWHALGAKTIELIHILGFHYQQVKLHYFLWNRLLVQN